MIVSELLSSDDTCVPVYGAYVRTAGPGIGQLRIRARVPSRNMDHYRIQQQLHHLGVNIRTSVDSQTPLRLHPIKVKL